jgi:predicted DNA-binding WGR domain protein
MEWGRVGSRQRGQTMTLNDEAHADRHFKKKISEKKRQGYVEVDVDPVVKPVKASAEAMADASLFEVMLEKNKHLYSRNYTGVPVEGRERVFVKFLNNLRMPEESLHDYLILSADARRGVQLIVKKRGHDPAHVDHRERPAVPGVARYRVTRIDARATQSLESGQTRTDVNDPSRHFASAVPEAVGLTPLIGKTGSCHKHRLRSESDPIRTLRVQVIGSANIGPQADEGAGRSAFPLGRRCAQSRRVSAPDRSRLGGASRLAPRIVGLANQAGAQHGSRGWLAP